jgi:NTP pyrophosphatase (non-canonical NTP hydrolase)
MDSNEYQEQIKRFYNNGLTPDQTLAHFALGLAGEAGEVVDLIKKHLFQGHSLHHKKVIEELGDVGFYRAGIANLIGCRLEDIDDYNIEKLTARYPNGFTVEDSINRRT